MTANRAVYLASIVLVIVILNLAAVITIAQDDPAVQERIDNAMSAAPMAIAKDAAILDVSPEGEIIELRAGSNGWTCFPDNPVSPGNDPICMDETFMVWSDAMASGSTPEITKPGLAYMLQGGSDASNTDPTLMVPPEGEDWIATPPHIMIIFPGELDPSVFPTDHMYGGPYVMWAGTPYEHIMMPVNIEEMAH